MCVYDPSTFVGSGGYHFDKKVKMSGLAPKTGGESGRRTVEQHQEATYLSRTTTAAMAAFCRELSWAQPTRDQS